MFSDFKIFRYLLLILTVFVTTTDVCSQEDSLYSSPQKVVGNHLHYMSEGSFDEEKAALSFPPQYSQSKREQLSQELKHFYDGMGLEIEIKKIPDDPDFIDSLTGKPEFVLFPKKYPEIYLKKSETGWYYSEETSEQISRLYRQIFPEWVDRILNAAPHYAKDKYLGIAIWQYIGFMAILLFIFLLHFILSWIVDKILEKSIWEKLHIGKQHSKNLYKLAKYVSLIILMALTRPLIPLLLLKYNVSGFLHNTVNIFQTIFIFLATVQVINIVRIYLMLMAEKTETKMDDQLIPLLIKSVKIIIGLIAFMHLLTLVGVNVTALIAGASIGGLAIALAAQDTFKNLFGSIMIFLDKPFQIGDFITTSDIEGTIEKIGFRSTRIRKIDTSVISVPNGNLANVTLTNLGIRRFRILDTTINILYSTPPDQIQTFLTELRKLPSEFPEIQQDTWLIYLRNLAPSSIDIYVRLYIEAADFNTELRIREAFIFKIIKTASDTGVSFAYPSTSVYIEKTPGNV
ncbi:MAG: mechanosensitive ion channel family protein [Saprospiraceae bacterium]|nr:mechanosensitive ion channel family protein [Saprospiraceae bacterium]